MSNLDLPCLKLNKNWAPIAIISVKKAFEDACAEAVTFMKFTDGYPSIFRIEDWMALEVEDGQDYITTSRLHGLKKIACPRVCICTSYADLLAKEQPCNSDNLHRRYKGKDAVTGKDLPRHKMSREHKIPRSKGGKNGWENEVPMDRELNSRRGNRDYSELGLQEPEILPPPGPLLPIHTMVNKHGWPEWRMFHVPDPVS